MFGRSDEAKSPFFRTVAKTKTKRKTKTKTTTGEDTYAGALRAPRAGSPVVVFVFVFLFVFVFATSEKKAGSTPNDP